jgi:uncharacterized membrane protein
MGLVRYALAIARNRQAGFAEVIASGPLLTYLGAAIVVSLGVMAGLVVCVVPGIILALGWSQFSYLIVDRKLGAIDSIGTSWRITNGHKGNLFLLMLLGILVSIAGLLACCVGLLVAIPIVQFAMAYVYLRLNGEEPVALA